MTQSFEAGQSRKGTHALRLIAAVMAAVLLMVAIPATLPSTTSADMMTVGDVNFDGKINAMDATRVLLAVVAKIVLDKEQTLQADTNLDNNVTAMDATFILLHTVGVKPLNDFDDTPDPDTSDPDTSDPSITPDEPYEPNVGLETVVFSAAAGYYDEEVELELSAPAGYTIYYTLDGSDPRYADTRVAYTDPITIKSSFIEGMGPLTQSVADLMGTGYPSTQLVGTSVRAYATNGSENTVITTNTYFVMEGLAEEYHMPYICVTMDAADFGPTTGIYYTVMDDPYGTKEHKPAYCEVFDADGVRQAAQYAELSMNGNGSLVYYQKAMRLYFKKNLPTDGSTSPGKLKYDLFGGQATNEVGEVIDGFDCVVLRNAGNDTDGAHMRDALFQRIAAGLNADTQASQPVMVFINGEYWGVYWAMERYDDHYFNSHYGVAEENVVVLETPSPHVTDNNSSPYEVAEGVDGDQIPWEELVAYASSTDLSVDANFQVVADQVDLDSLIDVMAVNCFAVNWDWPGNNVKVWRNKNPEDLSGMDTKWRFCLVDLDMTAGLYNNTASTNMMSNLFSRTPILTKLFRAMMKNKTFEQQYIARYEEICNEIFTPDYNVSVLNGIMDEVEDAMKLHYTRWFNQSMSGWYDDTGYLNSFLKRRSEISLGHMYDYFGIR